ncbi:MAG: ankyrin repeat domain-containing protein [Parachlamydia sp.]|nr:ankyrin repeat domain-containing protein [Parachlamydia sp.]
MDIQVEPITFRQHLLHPFSFKVHGAKTYTAMIPVPQRIAALVAAVATAIFGIPFAVVGGPLVFYFFTRQFKTKRIDQIRQNNVPIPPVQNRVHNPSARSITPVAFNHSVGGGALHTACARGQLNQVRALLDRGASLISVDTGGNYPVHIAAMNGHHEIVQLLLDRRGEFGNSANSHNWNGKSPLSLALEKVIPSIGILRHSDIRTTLNTVCNHPLARMNLDRLVESLKPFAKYDVVRQLMQLQHNSVASDLLDRLMLSVLRDQHFADVGDPDAFELKLRSQPFIFNFIDDDVFVHIFERNDSVTVQLTKPQLYHTWVQAEGNLNQIKTRVLEARERPIQVPVAAPAVNMGVVTAASDGYRVWRLNGKHFEAHPDKVLAELCSQFAQQKRDSLQVTYENQAGTDVGGLRRQFVAHMFSYICAKQQFQKYENGLYRPQSRQNDVFPLLNAKDKQVCENLGKMIMFCLNASESYPTGLIFDPGTFIALIRMDSRFLNKRFEDINFNDPAIYASMFNVYKTMNRIDEDESKNIDRMERYLALTDASPNNDLTGAYGIVMLNDEIAKLNINANNVAQIKQHLPAIKEAVKKEIIENMRATFAPIHAIATGMKNSGFNRKVSFDNLRRKSPADLSKELQGIASKQEIIDCLSIPPGNIKTWMTNWINNEKTDQKKLELFLFAATGSPALGGNTRINFRHEPNGFCYHTCFRTIDINFNIRSEAEFVGIFEAGLAAVNNSPVFDVS